MGELSGAQLTAWLPGAIRLAVGVVFLWAAAGKLRTPRTAAEGVRGYGFLPEPLVLPAAVLLVAVEGFVALALLSGALVDVAIPVSIALVLTFLVAVTIKLRQGDPIPCACFGDDDEPVSGRTIARLSVLLVATLFLFVENVTAASPLRNPVAPNAGQAVLAAVLFPFVAWMLEAPALVGLVRGVRRTAATT